jgi:hypothetical protein
MKNLIVIFSLCLFSLMSLADVSPGQWTGFSTINNLFIEGSDEDPMVIVELDSIDDGYKPDNCKSRYITFHFNTAKGKSLYSMILASKLSGKSISFALINCHNDRPLVSAIRLD